MAQEERRRFYGPISRFALAFFIALQLLAPVLGIPFWAIALAGGATVILLVAGQ